LWDEEKRNFEALEELCFRPVYHKIKRRALGAEESRLAILSDLPMREGKRNGGTIKTVSR
jgi:hypothetical protein